MAYYSNNTKFDVKKRWDWHKVDLVAVQSVNPKYFDKVKKDSEKKAKEDYFENILSYVLSESRSKYNTVFSAEDLNSHKLDDETPKESALYYYTLRNNVVHSGKIFSSENEMLFDALIDLLKIFEGVLEVVRNE